jgi:signal transduction histidine kinase
VGLSYVAAGLVALDRRPGNATGVLMIAYAISWYFGNWSNLNVAGVPMIGLAGALLSGVFIAHAALGYPTGRLRTGFERFVISLIYAVNVAVCVVILLSFDPRTSGCTKCAWEPAPFPSRTAVLTALWVAQRSGFLIVPVFLLATWLRWRRSTPAGRRDLTPLWVGIGVVGLADLLEAFASPVPRANQFSYLLSELQSLLNISLPIILVWGLLSARLARSAVGDLVVDLERPLRPGELPGLLARTLGDPSLDLLYVLEGSDRWVDSDGRPRTLPGQGERLQADLRALGERASADPDLAAAIDQAATELKQAIAELRELARGIHPAILTEEGPAAAVEALPDRSAVPVRVRAGFEGRLSEPVEAVAYFVVTESIANVIKYAKAGAARVELSRCDGMLLVEVSDDGIGGADVSRGSGLRGLADRVAAVRGTFGVQSPPGGGTRVRAEIPVAGGVAAARAEHADG